MSKNYQFRDPYGNPISWEKMKEKICEGVLVHYMNLVKIGIPQSDMQFTMGKQGGMIQVRGKLFMNPIISDLMTEKRSKELFENLKSLLQKFDNKEIPAEEIHRMYGEHGGEVKLAQTKKMFTVPEQN